MTATNAAALATWVSTTKDGPRASRCAAQLGYDAPAVSKLDRISPRSVSDFSELLKLSGWQRRALICLDPNLDTTTTTGVAMAQVTVTFAEMERKMAERTRDGMANIKAATGKHLGRVSVLPPATLEGVRELRSTLSMAKTAAMLNAEGVLTATGATWYGASSRRWSILWPTALQGHLVAPRFQWAHSFVKHRHLANVNGLDPGRRELVEDAFPFITGDRFGNITAHYRVPVQLFRL